MNKTVLVVDDNAMQLKLTGSLLRPDYDAVLVSSGEEALDCVQQVLPDIILLDVAMPEMDGYETLRRIKEIPAAKNIPVILFTGNGDDAEEVKGLSQGANDFVTKPVIPALLHQRINTQLELYDNRHRLEEQVEERTSRLRQFETVTISSLATLAETRDTDTGNHIRRTRRYVEILGKTALEYPRFDGKINEYYVANIIASAPLHDIGKVGIPDVILNKPGKLTDDEMTIMKTHVDIGEKALLQMIKGLDFDTYLNTAVEMAGFHHERWDGRGYQKGLAGKQIPISARIMAIADVYDALCAKRVYKEPMPHEKALRIIEEGANTQFDPDLVELFKLKHEEFAEINQLYADT